MIEDKIDQINVTELESLSQIEEVKARIRKQPYCPECGSKEIIIADRIHKWSQETTATSACNCGHRNNRYAAEYEILIHGSDWVLGQIADSGNINWYEKGVPIEEDVEIIKTTVHCQKCFKAYQDMGSWNCDAGDFELFNEPHKIEVFCPECDYGSSYYKSLFGEQYYSSLK